MTTKPNRLARGGGVEEGWCAAGGWEVRHRHTVFIDAAAGGPYQASSTPTALPPSSPLCRPG